MYGINGRADDSPLTRGYTWAKAKTLKDAQRLQAYAQRAWPEFKWSIGPPIAQKAPRE